MPCASWRCSPPPTTPTGWCAASWTAAPWWRSRTPARWWTSSARWAPSSSPASRPGPQDEEWILTAANWMYVNSHFVVTTTFLVWLYIARNHAFYYVRNMFMVAMGLALVGYVMFPTAPPRFLPEWGFTDTVAAFVGRRRVAERERALQPVRRGAQHARGLRTDDRHARHQAGAPHHAEGPVGALPGRGHLRGGGHRQPLLARRRARRTGGRRVSLRCVLRPRPRPPRGLGLAAQGRAEAVA